MFQKFATKYGLASHLGILAALPVALFPFLSVEDLSKTIFWISGLAVFWILFEPSLRKGEHLSQARSRSRKEILLSPLTWFLFFWILFTFTQWLNNGISLFYDAEAAKWLVKEAVAGIPGSAGSSGLFPFAVSLAVSVFIIGVFFALGYNARICSGVAACSVTGLGGLFASLAVSFGWSDVLLEKALISDPVAGPFMGSMFGVWLIVSIACCAQAESCRWGFARFLSYFAIAGNGAGLLFFAPLPMAQLYGAVALVSFVFALVWTARTCSGGATPRVLVVCAFGLASSFIVLKACAPESFSASKLAELNPFVPFNEVYAQIKNTLSSAALKIWGDAKWFGAGVGAYEIQLPFSLENSQWAVLPQNPKYAVNGYLMLLAERGIVGCSVILTLLLTLVSLYFERMFKGAMYIRTQEDSDGFFFTCLPVVWIVPFAIATLFVDIAYTSASSSNVYILTIAVPLALAAASFPKAPKQASKA